MEGFLREECRDTNTFTTNTALLKCPFSDVLYNVSHYSQLLASTHLGVYDIFTAKCPNDIHYYQQCGNFRFKTESYGPNTLFLCSFFVCSYLPKASVIGGFNNNAFMRCDGVTQCADGADEADCDSIGEFHCYVFGGYITNDKVCDRKCDCIDCEEEIYCHGYWHRYYCMNSTLSIYVFHMCDGIAHCPSGDDELNCPSNPESYCEPEVYYENNFVLNNYTRCFLWSVCQNKYDQTNCSNPDLTPLKCEIEGKLSTVSKEIICVEHIRTLSHAIHSNSSGLCDDGIDTKCEYTSPLCLIHKHQLCDGFADCIDSSDEKNFFCREVMHVQCSRRFSLNRTFESLDIPLAWIDDGVEDCLNGIDEIADLWPKCHFEQFSEIVPTNFSCSDVFICPNKKDEVVEFLQLCDNYESCGNENDICHASDGSVEPSRQVPYQLSNRYYLNYCLPGLGSLQYIIGACNTSVYPKDTEVLGANLNEVTFPTYSLLNCSSLAGELYVFYSCLSLCAEGNECPLKAELSYNSCPNQFEPRIYSLVRNDHITFLKKSKGSYFIQNLFECTNGRCIPYEEVCDFADNCGDNSDEEPCINHFKCNNSAKFLPKSYMCNGVIDCADLSDECNNFCAKEIISSLILKVCSWTIGILAVLCNMIIITKNISDINSIQSSSIMFDKALIMLIGFGDGLVGLYLLMISFVDAYYRATYCANQLQWLSHFACPLLGIISTIGCQVSLFAMTVLSLSRMIKLWRGQHLFLPVKRRDVMALLLLISTIFFTSVVISVVPILPRLEDKFVNSILYKGVPLFKGLSTKSVLIDVIQQYYSKLSRDASKTSWKTVQTLISSMFTNSYEGITGKKITFYGNDGVCLFKYFVLQDDPQLFYSWFILGSNFTCFAFITYSYIFVTCLSVRSSSKLSSSGATGKLLTARNQKLQRKITIIITTDFVCWVPFIIISFLHTIEAMNASKWYPLFSIIILPINSVVNPILYDTTIPSRIGIVFRYLKKNVCKATNVADLKSEVENRTQIVDTTM